MTGEEVRIAIELDRYFAIIPAFKTAYRRVHFDYANESAKQVDRPYNSTLETPLTRQELSSYLQAGGLFAQKKKSNEMVVLP